MSHFDRLPVTPGPEQTADVRHLDLTAAARFIRHSQPGQPGWRAALDLWKTLTGITDDDEARDYARRIEEQFAVGYAPF